MTRATMWALLAVVAAAAAVLSFASLRDLAALCGFSPGLAWLLPVVIDAGAAAGCLTWLAGDTTERARRFARGLTIVLLASSVGGNAVVHYLGAYTIRPAWWLVVAVSAVAPAVLGAVVHLAVLVGRMGSSGTVNDRSAIAGCDEESGGPVVGGSEDGPTLPEGLGRRRLAAELGVTEHRARQLLAAERGGVSR